MGIWLITRVRKNKANLVSDQASGVRDLTPNHRPPKPWGGCTNKPDFRVTAGTAVVLMGKMPMLRNALRRHYEQDFYAKQTQFGPRQGEGQVACDKGVMTNRTCKEHWKNKANSRPGREWARAGAVDCAKRTQMAVIGSRSEDRSCKTNPIRVGTGRDAGRQGCPWHRLCKTNPIRKGVGRGRPTLDQVEGGLHEEPIMQNKAKLGQDGTSGRRCQLCKTNPIWGRTGCPWRRLCETKPIRRHRPGRFRRNKANRRGLGGRPVSFVRPRASRTGPWALGVVGIAVASLSPWGDNPAGADAPKTA